MIVFTVDGDEMMGGSPLAGTAGAEASALGHRSARHVSVDGLYISTPRAALLLKG